MNDDYLVHYGVLGMKWGVRKKRETKSTGKPRSSSKKKQVDKASVIKQRVQNTLSKIDKQKVKKVVKTGAIVAGAITLGPIASVAISDLIYDVTRPETASIHTFPYGVTRGTLPNIIEGYRPKTINRTEWLWPDTSDPQKMITQMKNLYKMNPDNPSGKLYKKKIDEIASRLGN